MKTVAHWMRKARSLSREFQSGIDEMVREAELEDARKALESTRHGNLQRTIGNAIDPEGELTSEVKSVEREAGREPGASASEAAPSAEAGKDGNAGRAAATMTTQPLNIAPAHSLKPAEAPAAAGEGQQGRSEEHTSELQSLMRISYAGFRVK